MARPMKLTSETTRKKVRCGTLTVIVGFHEKTNTPYELHVIPGKNGTCKSNISAISDLIDELLRLENGLDLCIKSLSGHVCNGCKAAIMEAKGKIVGVEKELTAEKDMEKINELTKQLKDLKETAGMEMSCPSAILSVLLPFQKEKKDDDHNSK